MILTPKILKQITDAIEGDPDEPVTLPDWAYGADGRCVVRVDGLQVDLHRHLHELLIRPLDADEVMWQRGLPRNINPHLFVITRRGERPDTHCPNGHQYEGNEAPPNSQGYRCAICLADRVGTPREAVTHCPANHEYTPENTLVGKDGKRRCRTCRRDRNREYMRNLRATTKGAS